jgi:hypothetical protein
MPATATVETTMGTFQIELFTEQMPVRPPHHLQQVRILTNHLYNPSSPFPYPMQTPIHPIPNTAFEGLCL